MALLRLFVGNPRTRERGEADRIITRQGAGLENADPSNLIVAYEPIWAIGTGKTCEAKDAINMFFN